MSIFQLLIGQGAGHCNVIKSGGPKKAAPPFVDHITETGNDALDCAKQIVPIDEPIVNGLSFFTNISPEASCDSHNPGTKLTEVTVFEDEVSLNEFKKNVEFPVMDIEKQHPKNGI